MQACAIYLVDEQTAEFRLALYKPRSLHDLAAELEKQCKKGALDQVPLTVERLASAWDALRSHVETIDWQQEEP